MVSLTALRKIIGWGLIGLGIWIFFPIPGPDDIINIVLGGYISEFFNVDMAIAVLSTYIIIGPALIYLGCVVLPGNTQQLFHGFLGKIKNIAVKVVTTPQLLIAAIVMLAILYYVYILYISDFVSSSINGLTGGII